MFRLPLLAIILIVLFCSWGNDVLAPTALTSESLDLNCHEWNIALSARPGVVSLFVVCRVIDDPGPIGREQTSTPSTNRVDRVDPDGRGTVEPRVGQNGPPISDGIGIDGPRRTS
jgi:hypothetical protein